MKINDNLKFDLFKDEEKYNELLHNINLKLIPTKINHNVWQVNFRYKTARGNKRENYKYTIAEDGTDARINFLNYIKEFNENNQHRQLLNVKILNVNYVGQIEQSY